MKVPDPETKIEDMDEDELVYKIGQCTLSFVLGTHDKQVMVDKLDAIIRYKELINWEEENLT